MIKRPSAVLLVLAAAGVTGCAQRIGLPDLGGIYNRAAQAHDELRNPIIVIPGILGSKLVDAQSGHIVWGAFAGDYANPEKPEGARLVALPMRDGDVLSELRDAVVPNGSLDRIKVDLMGLPIELDAYRYLLGTLGVGGYRDETLGDAGAIDYGDDHYTCFQFAYDWRRDNVENAQRLHEFILEKRAYVQSELKKRFGIQDAKVKFDMVAHSMGCLIARYYLRYGADDLSADGSPPEVTWAGARYVDRAILVAAPNAGTIHALEQLVWGAEFSFFLPEYAPAILGTMPAVYQLLPRPRHGAVREDRPDGPKIDILDPAVWEQRRWGLADPKQDRVLRTLLPTVEDASERRRIALDHLQKCLGRARQFFAALDKPARPPDGLELSLIAGDAVPTDAVVSVTSGGAISVIEREPGDGRILRSSALMDERVGGDWTRGVLSPIQWRQVTFLFTDHLGLTSDPVFVDNVLYQLLEEPRRALR